MRTYKRVIMVVISGLGIGPAPDAGKFMDRGADTVGDLNAHFRARLQLPNLSRLGLARFGSWRRARRSWTIPSSGVCGPGRWVRVGWKATGSYLVCPQRRN